MSLKSEWREVSTLLPENMSERELDSLVEACNRLSDSLQAVRDFTPLAGSPLDPARLYAVIRDYALRHRFAGRFLKRLLSIPETERTYPASRLKVIHGDFHAKNLGFADGRLAAVFDFDKLTQGRACSDFVNCFGERYSLLRMNRAGRRRLAVAAKYAFGKCPRPREELVAAANVVRLTFAARRLEKHPDSAWIVFDVLRRDRRIRGILKVIL